MKAIHLRVLGAPALLASLLAASGEIKVVVDHNDNASASATFRFKTVPSPAKTDVATNAKFALVDGERDQNGGFLPQLRDGLVPAGQDQPEENFFFNAGTDGGRFALDLGTETEVTQINTYSWHPNTRGPQVYKLYASVGTTGDFNPTPKRDVNPEQCGWKLIASVDTRPKGVDGGGQYGVSISDSTGSLGKYRYLLFDCSRTEADDAFGNTFYSEIDVISGTAALTSVANAPVAPFVIKSTDGKCEITIDTSGAPDLKEWAEQKLAPVLAEWYPKIVALLPSEGYEPPTRFSVNIRPGNGVAATRGTRVTANSTWLARELNREAIGALLHEEVHVVQQYGWARRNNPNATRSPGWLTEAIPDYIRWFLFEPESHGADIVWMKRQRNFTPKYDTAYRPGANFLNWVTEKYAKDLVTKLNATIRSGKYTEEIWKDVTGKTAPELGEEWKTHVLAQIASPADASPPTAASPAIASQPNTLTDAEKAVGWKLLFDGKTLNGWHNFKREGIRPGWQVKDGALVCVDPHDAGDIVTTEKFGAFEFELEYNISEAGNSGIIYHVTDEGGAVWQTGPEVQLEDNEKAADPQRCGWLYGLYQPPDDPKTGKPLDATKPVGQWNRIRLVITPEKCEHYVNGVKYFDYVLGSEDFNARVAKSKFGRMRGFAKAGSGYLALQGDHGQVSFRNIKIRPIAGKP
jgi:hypothetical protein